MFTSLSVAGEKRVPRRKVVPVEKVVEKLVTRALIGDERAFRALCMSLDGMTSTEISHELGMPRGTVDSLIYSVRLSVFGDKARQALEAAAEIKPIIVFNENGEPVCSLCGKIIKNRFRGTWHEVAASHIRMKHWDVIEHHMKQLMQRLGLAQNTSEKT